MAKNDFKTPLPVILMALAIAGMCVLLFVIANNPYIVSGKSLILSLSTCVFLLINHKSYRVAAFISWVVLIFSLNSDFTSHGDGESSWILYTAGALVSLGLAYYSRHPFMNRRQRWLAAESIRHPLQIDVFIYPGNHAAQTVDLSTLGTKIRLHGDVPAHFKPESKVTLRIPLCPLEDIKAKIIAIEGNNLRLKFQKFSMTDEQVMALWLEAILKASAAHPTKV